MNHRAAWLRSQPWYVRLDEWQHDHGSAGVWGWLWRPVCNAAERHHLKGAR